MGWYIGQMYALDSHIYSIMHKWHGFSKFTLVMGVVCQQGVVIMGGAYRSMPVISYLQGVVGGR